MKNMKIAINHYGRFESPFLDLFLNKLDSFIVTPKIEKSKQFQTGLARRKFQIIEVTDLAVVERAVNVTDKIIENFREALSADPEPEEPTPPAEPVAPPADEKTPEDEGEKTEETPKEEDQGDDGAGEDSDEGEGVQADIPFTELAKNKEEALAMIEKETDIEKLKGALNDDRKYVKEAVAKRLNALEG
jgi:hypothetical protein